MIKIPEIVWSDWWTWERRDEIPESYFPGIYRLAVGIANQKLTDKNGFNRVRYIGMTNNMGEEGIDPELLETKKRIGLRQRWDQLDRTLRGGRGHSGAKKIREEYGLIDGSRFPEKNGGNRLFVSCYACRPSLVKSNAVSISELENPEYMRLRGIVACLEYEAFALYTESVGRNLKPKFNTF